MGASAPGDQVDVLIVGAGASGAAVAWSLSETRMHILCLEQGGWMRPDEYPSTRRDWEQLAVREYSPNPNIRARPEDYPINDVDSPIAIVNFNGVGGSTVMYAAHFPRLHPSDFRTRTLDGVGEDWPIDYPTLEPFFALNDRMTGVSGLAGDPAYPRHELPLPPVPMGSVGSTMARAFNALGWHWWPSDTAIVTREYEGREACANLGPCMTGCARGAKSTTDVTYWPAALRAGVELRTHCRVREVLVGDDGMATGVIYYDDKGIEHMQRAHVVVLACNGVGTARLLLNSKSQAFPEGLANRSGLVGKNLMLHPWGMVRGTFPSGEAGNIGAHLGPSSCAIWSQQFYETDTGRDFVRGYNLQVTRSQGPVSTARYLLGHGALPWGAEHHRELRRHFGNMIGIGVCCEDLPEEVNRVTLDATLTDSSGIPAPKITYRLGENSRRMLDHGVARAVEALQAAGATGWRIEAPLRPAGWHLLGTARMGTDPKRSVVNEWGRAHDVRNLFIVDGSVFVTGGGVNPTTTIQAVALYIADQMKRRLATLFE